jgi:thiol-disulfide isomerase/thioredoxin
MKKLLWTMALALFATACMFKPLPEVPVLGSVELPVAAEEEVIWKSADYQGKPMILVFMGSWCPYCKRSMPAVQAAAEAYGDKAEIVAIFVDQDAATVQAVTKEHNFTVKSLYDGGEVAQRLGVSGLPHAMLFNKKHQLVKVWEGFRETLQDEFTEHLNKHAK